MRPPLTGMPWRKVPTAAGRTDDGRVVHSALAISFNTEVGLRHLLIASTEVPPRHSDRVGAKRWNAFRCAVFSMRIRPGIRTDPTWRTES